MCTCIYEEHVPLKYTHMGQYYTDRPTLVLHNGELGTSYNYRNLNLHSHQFEGGWQNTAKA